MSEYIRRVDNAKKEVKEAAKALKDAKKQKERNLKQLEKQIQECEDLISKPRKEFASVKLYLDHVEFGGASYVLNEHTRAELITSGEITSKISSTGSNGISVGGALIGGKED